MTLRCSFFIIYIAIVPQSPKKPNQECFICFKAIYVLFGGLEVFDGKISFCHKSILEKMKLLRKGNQFLFLFDDIFHEIKCNS